MSPAPHNPAETQSTVTVADFIRAWMRFRGVFIVGLIIVAVGTFIWTKFVLTRYYRAEATFYVGESFTADSRIGMADADLFDPALSEKIIVVQKVIRAEQMLQSPDLLLEASRKLAEGADGGDPIDLPALLNLEEEDQQQENRVLTEVLQKDLIEVIQRQNSGVVSLRVELPDPAAAARFANLCVQILNQRFLDDEFGYPKAALAMYQESWTAQSKLRESMVADLRKLENERHFDLSPRVENERRRLQLALEVQAAQIAQLNMRIQSLKLMTDPRSIESANPVRPVSGAWPPLKKIRPKTILSTIMASAVYTFVFMLGLMGVGLLESGAARRPRV